MIRVFSSQLIHQAICSINQELSPQTCSLGETTAHSIEQKVTAQQVDLNQTRKRWYTCEILTQTPLSSPKTPPLKKKKDITFFLKGEKKRCYKDVSGIFDAVTCYQKIESLCYQLQKWPAVLCVFRL